MYWSPADIADATASHLRRCAEASDREQAVYGLDSLDELGLHPLIAAGLRAAGFGAWPEQRYPGDWKFARRSEGKRCDLVLTPHGLPLRDQQVRDTLFDAVEATDPENAYWLEIKTVAQFESSGPAKRYSAELLSPVAGDVKKLWSDGVIRHGGLLLALFTLDREVAEHDMAVWHGRCLDRGYPIAAPAQRGFAIADRIGNAWCALGAFGVRGV